MKNKNTFSFLITTKNRKTDLAFTLDKIKYLLKDNSVECVVFDDGSTDGTYAYVKKNFPKIQLRSNAVSKGYIFCRNKMLNETKADYAISLDDDAHFLTENALEIIRNHFEENAHCGLLALRIFWGLQEPFSKFSNEKPHRVQDFVGCAHVWRMKTWRTLPNYPEWFVFYGEENFASYHLFKKNWQIHYLPEVLVHHRVDVRSRRKDADYTIRLRRSLRSGWYLFFLFYPIAVIPRKMAYSLWMQFKLKVFKGDFKALQAILLALFDLVLNIPRILKNSNRLTLKEYIEYSQLPEAKIYWQPGK
ncbi:glycosyltransferase family 2 protein [Flavobacterium soyangense]|uniref:Glycosyltransferase n=1 Tax=Flavobacterium soyangense TaxID=2023265 RepID=A0A930UBG2_9FLAO|nr:glycosyltransferase family 2 protein [Flavobacterium soyangense]MBF2708236.1 glycosyltransferase [Flavobacterium soyangense]